MESNKEAVNSYFEALAKIGYKPSPTERGHMETRLDEIFTAYYTEGSTKVPPMYDLSNITRAQIPPDTILVGKKPIMAYATAVMMHFQSGAQTLTVKARGRTISTAVDVVVVRRRFFAGKLAVQEINIGTQMLGEGSDTRNVSTIEIKLRKTG